MPTTFAYSEIWSDLIHVVDSAYNYPCLIPNWDNTPRNGANGLVLKDSTPALFALQVEKAIMSVRKKAADYRIVFVKSWNEWAEGNHLEPDLRFGRGYLNAMKKALHIQETKPYALAMSL